MMTLRARRFPSILRGASLAAALALAGVNAGHAADGARAGAPAASA